MKMIEKMDNKVNIEQERNYICSICGQKHIKKEICPIINKKIAIYSKSKKNNFLIGNIFIECIKKNVNIYDLLYEISYIAEMYMERSRSIGILNAELLMDYCSQELKINPNRFYKRPENTISEILKLCDYIEYESTYRNEDKEVDKIVFKSEAVLPQSRYNNLGNEFFIYLTKERTREKNWCYRVYLRCPSIIINGLDDNKYKYWLERIDGFENDIILGEDIKGDLAKYIEKEIDFNWYEIAEPLQASDVRFEIWINKLLKETASNILRWNNYENTTLQLYNISHCF